MIERDLRIRVGADAQRVAEQALAEDGPEDLTTRITVPEGLAATGALEFRSAGVLAGTPYADAVALAAGLQPTTWYQAPGSPVPAGATAGLVRGELASVLRAERPMLNLLLRATGIATATRAFVDRVAGTRARILHTRKTAPGLRLLDVTAVLAGGGHAHRLDLGETVMVKDNHWWALAQGGRTLAAALQRARAEGVNECFVEVETTEQLIQACQAGADRLLIDNQTPATVRKWSDQARALAPGIEIEATGGISLENVRQYAEAGADWISIGALTHSVKAADISLEIRAVG
jgi:nicotinate-nucleotide pyrophosphorylase (carboxylating)